MAFNSYIILDGFRYKTVAKEWRPSLLRAASTRLTLQGNLEGTFGVGALCQWEGALIAAHGETAPTPADGSQEGNIVSLRASLAKTQALSFTDHYGTVYSQAVLQGPFEEQSLVNVWNATGNKYYVRVQIIAKAQ